jgi:hypothetical protein
MLWHGSAASAIDLNPPGYDRSSGLGIAGTSQVGWGAGPATGGLQHALLWNSTAASGLDLHSYLTGLGPNFTSSVANGVADNGTIVGTAYDGNHSYAVLWMPVPEPSSLGLLTLAATALIPPRRRNSVCPPTPMSFSRTAIE